MAGRNLDFFYSHYIGEISKVVSKNFCHAIRPRNLTQSCLRSIRLLWCGRFIQHKLVINGRVSDSFFLQTTLLISCKVRVKRSRFCPVIFFFQRIFFLFLFSLITVVFSVACKQMMMKTMIFHLASKYHFLHSFTNVKSQLICGHRAVIKLEYCLFWHQ